MFRIRPAVVADAPCLGRLGAALIALHHDFDPSRFIAPTPLSAERYGEFLVAQRLRDDAVVLVAEDDGRVLGYAYGSVEGNDLMALRGPAGVLHDLMVDPDDRARGIGRALVAAIRDAFVRRDAPRLVLSAAARNEAARRLFERLGFRPTMIEMTMDLNP
jgi:ribosomal protein S18 acetylase RimI-like enzyme